MLRPEHHSKTAAARPAEDPKLKKPPIVEERSLSSSSTNSSSETKKAEQVLDVLKTTFNLKHLKTVKDVALQQVDGEPINDKTYLMERIIQLASDMPVSSRTSATLTNTFLPGDFWRMQLETANKYADGIVIWCCTGKQTWDDEAPWWLETQKFIKQIH